MMVDQGPNSSAVEIHLSFQSRIDSPFDKDQTPFSLIKDLPWIKLGLVPALRNDKFGKYKPLKIEAHSESSSCKILQV